MLSTDRQLGVRGCARDQPNELKDNVVGLTRPTQILGPPIIQDATLRNNMWGTVIDPKCGPKIGLSLGTPCVSGSVRQPGAADASGLHFDRRQHMGRIEPLTAAAVHDALCGIDGDHNTIGLST